MFDGFLHYFSFQEEKKINFREICALRFKQTRETGFLVRMYHFRYFSNENVTVFEFLDKLNTNVALIKEILREKKP